MAGRYRFPAPRITKSYHFNHIAVMVIESADIIVGQVEARIQQGLNVTTGAAHKLAPGTEPRNMNLNNHDQTTQYRELLPASRRKRRSLPLLRYNDGSAEVGAMNAHLRAAAYGGQKSMPPAKKSARSLLDLSREY